MKNCFPDAKPIKKFPKHVLCKKCTYVQNNLNQVGKSSDFPKYNEHTFSASYFYENLYLMWKLLKKV